MNLQCCQVHNYCKASLHIFCATKRVEEEDANPCRMCVFSVSSHNIKQWELMLFEIFTFAWKFKLSCSILVQSCWHKRHSIEFKLKTSIFKFFLKTGNNGPQLSQSTRSTQQNYLWCQRSCVSQQIICESYNTLTPSYQTEVKTLNQNCDQLPELLTFTFFSYFLFDSYLTLFSFFLR